jgi:hypothetical protein
MISGSMALKRVQRRAIPNLVAQMKNIAVKGILRKKGHVGIGWSRSPSLHGWFPKQSR